MLHLTIMDLSRNDISDILRRGTEMRVNDVGVGLTHVVEEHVDWLKKSGRLEDGHTFDVATYNHADKACWRVGITLRFKFDFDAGTLRLTFDTTAGCLVAVDGVGVTPQSTVQRGQA